MRSEDRNDASTAILGIGRRAEALARQPSRQWRLRPRSLCHNSRVDVVDEIARFASNADEGELLTLARAALAFQIDRIPPIRDLCDRCGITASGLTDWRDIPLVPVTAFQTLLLSAGSPVEVFRSSGTTGGERSTHYHSFPDLYRQVVDASFPQTCLPVPPPVPMLSLIGDRALLPDSSLAFMVEHVLARWGEADSLTAFSRRGVETTKARSWLAARQRQGRPVLILSTAFALLDLLDGLARVDLRFRLAPGSAIFETGGFKGRTREITRPHLLALVSDRLGVPSERVVREYGMTELTSQCYTRALAGGDPELFVPPHWMRVRALDPVTLAEQPAGAVGVLAILDLANVGSALHLLTADLGATTEDGFRLLGRASDADLRGCSLVAEGITVGRDGI
jgi:Acyl-protein synthetase, LuxE